MKTTASSYKRWWSVITKNFLLSSPHAGPLVNAFAFIKLLTFQDFPGIHLNCLKEVQEALETDKFVEVELGMIADGIEEIQAYNATQMLYYQTKAY